MTNHPPTPPLDESTLQAFGEMMARLLQDTFGWTDDTQMRLRDMMESVRCGLSTDRGEAVIRFLAAHPRETPAPTPLATMAVEINEINRANGWAVLVPDEWSDTYKIPGILALIHSEVSEALEGFRRNDKTNFAEELADVLIRVLDCAGGLGIDLDAEVAAKLTKNRARGFKHGGKRV